MFGGTGVCLPIARLRGFPLTAPRGHRKKNSTQGNKTGGDEFFLEIHNPPCGKRMVGPIYKRKLSYRPHGCYCNRNLMRCGSESLRGFFTVPGAIIHPKNRTHQTFRSDIHPGVPAVHARLYRHYTRAVVFITVVLFVVK